MGSSSVKPASYCLHVGHGRIVLFDTLYWLQSDHFIQIIDARPRSFSYTVYTALRLLLSRALKTFSLFSASLAQVHIAYSKDGKNKYAVKVQHEGLLDNAKVRQALFFLALSWHVFFDLLQSQDLEYK